MTKTTKTLLLIDDSVSFCERIQNEGEDRNWTVLVTAELNEIRPWLDGHHPDVVLLDWQLPGKKRNDYVQLLKAKELTARTLLLSGTFDEECKKFIAQHGLAGVRLKPLDMAHFEEAIALPSSAQSSPTPDSLDLKTVLDDLPLAANILDANLMPIWGNARAKQEPLTPEHCLIARWLKAEMNDAASKATRRIDWDGEKKAFLESRLYPLNDGNYWLARDWRSEGDRPHDHELLNLDDQTDRTTWLQAVARLLAQRYAIGIFRVYKVAQLRHCAAYESADERLMIPLFQSGGGFATTAEAWCGTGFLASANENTNAIFQANYQPAPELVHNSSSRCGCDSISYGPECTQRIQFPVRDKTGKIVALFALDRRLDHKADITDIFDKEVVAIADRMANDAKALDATQWSLMQGLVEDIGDRLGKWLSDGEEKCRHSWHEKISRALMEVFATPERSPEMTYDALSQVCRKLAAEWEDSRVEIEGGYINRTTLSPDGEMASAISSWHITLETSDTRWQAVAGWGRDFDDCRRCGSRQIQEPHGAAFSATPWKAMVIQDYRKWIETAANSCACDHRHQCHDIGSWLAVPMIIGQKRALMIVHSPCAYYFTEFSSELMEHAAKRILPLLFIILSAVRVRATFALAVMHEVKNDAHAALLLLNEMQQSAQPESWVPALAEVRHHLEGLELLGQDTLDLFRVGLGAHNVDRQPDDKDTTVNLKEFFAGVILSWNILYEETEARLALSTDLLEQRVTIHRPLAFKRVLRTLLHNAFRHGRDWVSIRIVLDNKEESNGISTLTIAISNPIPSELADALGELGDPTGATTSSSPLTRGHMGLAVSKQLCADAGGTLEDLKTSAADDEEIVQANVTVHWPVSLAALINEETP